MRILITNAFLNIYGGTQVVVRDLALELRRQGHEAMIYSPRLGEVAEELRRAGIAVSDSLADFTATPDVIHGQHYPTIEALLRFPQTPAVYVCHGSMRNFLDVMVYIPRIRRYVAVDEPCRRLLASIPGLPPERIQMELNAVDLERFKPRAALPARPRRALIFSNNTGASSYVRAVRKACRRAGVQVDVLGEGARNAVANPEAVLPQYDIVLAKARCALEAMAVGNAVVLCDMWGLGPMVSNENFDRLRPMNFGYTQLTNPIRPELIRAEIERYNPDDAAAVCARVRREAGLAETARRWVALYEEVITEHRQSPPERDEELRALADYWSEWNRNFADRLDWEDAQIRKVRAIPVVGGALVALARRILRKHFDADRVR